VAAADSLLLLLVVVRLLDLLTLCANPSMLVNHLLLLVLLLLHRAQIHRPVPAVRRELHAAADQVATPVAAADGAPGVGGLRSCQALVDFCCHVNPALVQPQLLCWPPPAV
jgi:hypothetical protein